MNLKKIFSDLSAIVQKALLDNTSSTKTANFPNGFSHDGETILKPGTKLEYFLQSHGQNALSLELRNESFKLLPAIFSEGSARPVNQFSIPLGHYDDMATLELFDDFNSGMKLETLFPDGPAHPLWNALLRSEENEAQPTARFDIHYP